jgi:hypothetical protein
MATRLLTIALFVLLPFPSLGETACVKYGPCPLDLSSFECVDTPRSSFVRRVCYDEPKRFMAIKLQNTWYPYCAVDRASVDSLLSADSIGRAYNARFRSKPDGTHGPFDCRDHPIPSY